MNCRKEAEQGRVVVIKLSVRAVILLAYELWRKEFTATKLVI